MIGRVEVWENEFDISAVWFFALSVRHLASFVSQQRATYQHRL